MDDDAPVTDAAREIAAVATGVAVAARAKAERQAGLASQEAQRLEVRSRASGTWRGVERRDRPREVQRQEVEAALAERRQRGAQQDRALAWINGPWN